MTPLAKVFQRSKEQYTGGNESLQYHQTKNDDEQKVKGHVAASIVFLYKYGKSGNRSSPESLGKKAVAIVPCVTQDNQNKNSNKDYFCLICYELKTRSVIVSVTITPDFQCTLLEQNFLSFVDLQGCYWATRFPSKEIIEKFVRGIAMARVLKCQLNSDSHDLIIERLTPTKRNLNVNYRGSMRGENMIKKNENKDDDAHDDDKIKCERGDNVSISLKLWEASMDRHPFECGNEIYENSDVELILT